MKAIAVGKDLCGPRLICEVATGAHHILSVADARPFVVVIILLSALLPTGIRAVAPKTVTITGPSEAKVNDTISLECTTSNSNPESRIAWMLDGRDVKENGSRITTSPDGGWVSHSNLTTVIRATGRNLTVSCHAIVSGMSQRVAETKIVSVVCKSLRAHHRT